MRHGTPLVLFICHGPDRVEIFECEIRPKQRIRARGTESPLFIKLVSSTSELRGYTSIGMVSFCRDKALCYRAHPPGVVGKGAAGADIIGAENEMSLARFFFCRIKKVGNFSGVFLIGRRFATFF